jgi:hypothetical protein
MKTPHVNMPHINQGTLPTKYRRPRRHSVTLAAGFAAVAALGAVLTACGDDEENDQTALDKGPGGFAADFEASDVFFTRMSGLVPGQSPHGSSQIWYSSNLKPVIDDEEFTASEGTVSIKKFDMDEDGTVDGFAVMVKRAAGYHGANGDWYYEMRGVDGSVMSEPAAGKNAMCIGCHDNYGNTDYLAGTKLR